MSTQYSSITPQDACFFRDGRPYNYAESNQADVESVFPPSARTLTVLSVPHSPEPTAGTGSHEVGPQR